MAMGPLTVFETLCMSHTHAYWSFASLPPVAMATATRSSFKVAGLLGGLKRRSEGCSLPSSAILMARNFSDSSLGLVAELVWWHLLVRSLVRFKLVSKEWETWCSANLEELANVRRKTTASRDWYFPISFSRANGVRPVRAWSAMHHASDEEHAEDERRLPGLDFLPNWLELGRDLKYLANGYRIEAAAGGLLLLRYDENLLNSFPRLYVVNPLTSTWRYLSCRSCYQGLLERFYENILHAHIVVNEDLRKYTVVVLAKYCITMYNSLSEHWLCHRMRYFSGLPIPERTHRGRIRSVSPLDSSRFNFPGSSYANGDVFICSRFILDHAGEADSDGKPRYREMIEIQIFPMELEEGQQPAVTTVAADDFRARDFFLRFEESAAQPKLVECLGDIYLVASRCDVDCSFPTSAHASRVVRMREFHSFKFQEGSTVFPLHVSYVR